MKRTAASVPTHMEGEAKIRLNETVFFLQELDSQSLSTRFIEELAEEVGVDVRLVALPDDPVEQANALAERWISIFHLWGRDRAIRDTLCRNAIAKLAELSRVATSWRNDDMWKQWDEQARARFHE